MSRLRILLAAALLLALGVLFLVDPRASGLYPRCPFLLLTGLECAGCGSARALHALLHGDVVAAFRFNPLATVAAPFLLYAAAGALLTDSAGRRRLPRLRLARPLGWALVAAVPGLAIVRWIG